MLDDDFRIPEAYPRLLRELTASGMPREQAVGMLREVARRKWARARSHILGTLGLAVLCLAGAAGLVALQEFRDHPERGFLRGALYALCGAFFCGFTSLYAWKRGRGFRRIAAQE